jgi:hypothetical protein
MRKKWAYGLLAYLMALGMALPGAMAQEKATMQVTALSEGFEGTFPPTGWGWGNCFTTPGTCTNPGTRYWDAAVVSTDIPGRPHMVELGWRGSTATRFLLPLDFMIWGRRV